MAKFKEGDIVIVAGEGVFKDNKAFIGLIGCIMEVNEDYYRVFISGNNTDDKKPVKWLYGSDDDLVKLNGGK